MRGMRTFILGVLGVGTMLALGAGCGGGVAGGRPVPDAAVDSKPDGIDAGRPPGVMCPAVATGEKRGFGACCAAASDCTGGVCWNGFCTKTCVATADCGSVVAPSPLPVGTPMSCATNRVGDPFNYCLPGSLGACTSGGAVCPLGEACALGIDGAATQASAAIAYIGACLTKLRANEYLPVGSACQPEDGPYACENQGGYLGSGCFAHRCTMACAQNNDCPIGMQCEPPPYAAKLGGATSFPSVVGTGICLGRFCGQVHGEAGLTPGQGIQQGADALCVTGEVCVPTIAVGASGNTQYLSCVPPRIGALAFGATCSKDPAQNLRCADDTLCAERMGSRFCSKLCRVDGDCPNGAFCIDDYATAPLPNGSVARLGLCTPRALISGTTCHAEKDCAAALACLPAGGHSNLFLCLPAIGTKSVGQACAAANECRGGECFDRDLRAPTGANRTYCGGYCGKNSDCGSTQICLRVVRNSNATADDPRDDVVVGTCTPLDAPALTGGCVSDDNCTGQINIDETGGDTCDTVHRTCYTKAARIGDPCLHRADCPLGGYCRLNDPRFPGGACLSLGCDPMATAGVDACPAGSICVGRGATDAPLRSCYEGCTPGNACSRVAEGYLCEVVVLGQPETICIGQGGP
jgi:hypothetical protein